MKPSKCKVCGSLFTKSRRWQIICSPFCGLSFVQLMSEKNARKAIREKRQTEKMMQSL